MINYFSIREIKNLLAANNLRLKKRFGQNFLIDRNIAEKIVKNLDLSLDDIVLEIGPGLGVLSRMITDTCRRLIMFEIDRGFCRILQDEFKNYGNVSLINEDFIEHETLSDYSRIKVVSNLPYCVSTPVIFKLFKYHKFIDFCLLTTQHEVSRRILADENSKNYSALSVFVKTYFECEFIYKIGPNSFYPSPKVDSAIIKLKPTKKFIDKIKNYAIFSGTVNAIFSSRRKKLVNSLMETPYIKIEKEKINTAIKELNIGNNVRGEELSLEKIIDLSNCLL